VTPEARELFESEFHAPAYEHYRRLFHEHADELDAVAIVTPHTLHYEQAKAAIEHGLHVLVEKALVDNEAFDVAKSLILTRSRIVRDQEETAVKVRLIRRNGAVTAQL
jgi:vacuolar-type H+-ATPase subunit B/Vma2